MPVWMLSPATPETSPHTQRVGESSYFQGFPDERPIFHREISTDIELVMFPCALVEDHWTLLILDVESMIVRLLDPYYTATEEILDRAHAIVRGFINCYGLQNQDFLIVAEDDCKFQAKHTQNCGPYVACFMQKVCREEQIKEAKNENMVEFRKHMRVAILQTISPRPAYTDQAAILTPGPKTTEATLSPEKLDHPNSTRKRKASTVMIDHELVKQKKKN